jgi:hypothetical protein
MNLLAFYSSAVCTAGREAAVIPRWPDQRNGLLDDLLKKNYGRKTGFLFERAKLREPPDSILADEIEEHRSGLISSD